MNLFKTLILIGTLALAGISAEAQQKGHYNFLNGSLLNLPAQSTNSSPAVNSAQTTNSWTYATRFAVTNQTVTITNAANGLIITGYQSVLVPVYVTNGNAFADIDLWANQDGSIPSMELTAVYTSADGTNTTLAPVITLYPVAITGDPGTPGYPTVLKTNVQDLFTFTGPTLQATNILSIGTNLPTAFLQGEHRLRAQISVPSNGTNGAITFYGLWLNGWRPQPSL